jgi:hypothetical protein
MQLAESAVESHLRVIAGCDAPSGYFQTLSQAEPIVSEAATALLMCSHNHWENTMREPNDKPLNAGLTDRGPSGELVVRLLCILAHDAVLSKSSQPHEADRPEWAESFSVRTFLAALCRKAKTVHGRNKERQFKVKWQNWAINHASWEPESRLRQDMDPATLQKMIDDYRTGKKESTSQARARLRKQGSTANAMQAVEDGAKRDKQHARQKERPVLYLSRTLRSYERNYTILELELGAVVWSILKLQRYLDGVPFTVVTDHQPILQVVASNSKTLTSPRVQRWRMLLQPYMGQMTFVRKAGKTHLNVPGVTSSAVRWRRGSG